MGHADEGFEPDEVMVRVGVGIEMCQQGQRQAARQLFEQLWAEIGGSEGDAFHRCAIAHSMADTRDVIEEELEWDLRALHAADSLTDARAKEGGVDIAVAAFYPSLHLNIGECYRKLGDVDRSREHLRRGQAALDELPDNGYAAMIGNGFRRLADALA